MMASAKSTSPCKGEAGRAAAGRGSPRYSRTTAMTARAKRLRGKGEVGAPKVGCIRLWNLVRRVGVNSDVVTTPSLTLPLAGEGKKRASK